MSLGKLVLKTALSIHNGYGNDGVGLAIAFGDAGWDVYLQPSNVSVPLPPAVAELFCKPLDPPFDVLVHHTDPDCAGLTDYEIAGSRKRVWWSMWEFIGTGGMAGESTLAERTKGYTHALFYDDVSMGTLGPYLPEDTARGKLQGGYWADQWTQNPSDRDWGGTFRFGMAGALHARKNPFAAIECWNELREDGELGDSELHLKTNTPGLHPAMERAYPGLHIHYEMWPHDQMREFYLNTHLYLGPSWGEGKNLPALEAMSSGCPVAATDFGGHHEWIREDIGYPLTYSLAEHREGSCSARVDKDAMKDAMLSAYKDRSTAREKGARAAQLIPAQMDWARVVERFTHTIS